MHKTGLFTVVVQISSFVEILGGGYIIFHDQRVVSYLVAVNHRLKVSSGISDVAIARHIGRPP